VKCKARSVKATSLEVRGDSGKMENLVITKSLQGRKLKKPLVLKVLEPQCPADLKLQNFVIETFISRIHALAQFTFENSSTMKITRYLLFNRTASRDSLFSYIYGVHRFCKWANIQPDQLVKKCVDKNGVPKPKALVQTRCLIEDFVAHLQTENLSPSYIIILVKGVLALLRLNGLKLLPPFRLANYNICCDRAPSREELRKILDVADLRERVIITMLASGGFRIGTLAKLQYRHVKSDLERGVIPIHVYVPAEITKGKYNSYYTFVNWEAAEYLTAYLNTRRRGTAYIPPENIQDESPLIRCANRKQVKPVSSNCIYDVVHHLYFKAGLLVSSSGSCKDYDLRVHSVRKFFRTEMSARDVERDYIDFMMGHKVCNYHDIKMKGIEYLRGIYLTSGIGIQPKIRLNKIDVLKEIMCAWGLNPEEILTRKALEQSQATAIDQNQPKNHQFLPDISALDRISEQIRKNPPEPPI
jgi:hypothetical protein